MEQDKLQQLNVRVDEDLLERIEQKRIVLQRDLGRIPSRSEVIRMALDEFLSDGPGKRVGLRAAKSVTPT